MSIWLLFAKGDYSYTADLEIAEMLRSAIDIGENPQSPPTASDLRKKQISDAKGGSRIMNSTSKTGQ